MSAEAGLLLRAVLAAAVLLIGAVVQGRLNRSLERPYRHRTADGAS